MTILKSASDETVSTNASSWRLAAWRFRRSIGIGLHPSHGRGQERDLEEVGGGQEPGFGDRARSMAGMSIGLEWLATITSEPFVREWIEAFVNESHPA